MRRIRYYMEVCDRLNSPLDAVGTGDPRRLLLASHAVLTILVVLATRLISPGEPEAPHPTPTHLTTRPFALPPHHTYISQYNINLTITMAAHRNHKASHPQRLRALVAVQRANDTLTRFLFDSLTASQNSTKNASANPKKLLPLLEKQDRNLESQLIEVQAHVTDLRATLAASQSAFDEHVSIHGRVSTNHEQTVTSISQLAQLEDKKHACVTSRGIAINASSELKRSINVVRRERVLYKRMTEKYRKELLNVGGELVGVVKACVERMRRVKMLRDELGRWQEAGRREEGAWVAGWREEMSRMEAFLEEAGRGVRRRVEEKKRRMARLVGAKGAEGVATSSVLAPSMASPLVTTELAAAMTRVAARVLGEGAEGMQGAEVHMAIVRAFQMARKVTRARITMGLVGVGVGCENVRQDEDEVVVDSHDHDRHHDCSLDVSGADEGRGEPLRRYHSLVGKLAGAAGLGSVELGGEEGMLTRLAWLELWVLVNTRPQKAAM